MCAASSAEFRAAIAFAQDLIRIPSPPGDEGAVAARVVLELERLGFDEVSSDEVGNVIGVVRGTGDGPTVMLSSHLDIVDVGDEAAWEYPPFGGVVDAGFLHGRGAMDIKGPLAIQTHAAARFISRRAAGDVVVAHTVHEERGGWGMEHLMRSGAVRPAAVIIGEATNGDVCIGHRGRAELIVEIEGLAGHASAPERARNPMYALPALIGTLQEFAGALPADPLLGPSTLAPTMIETLPRSRNVIPDRVRIIVDWRVLPQHTPDSVREELHAFLQRHTRLPDGCTLHVRYSTEAQHTYTGQQRERTMFTPGYLLDPQHAVARAAARAVEVATGRAPALRPWTFATDGGHTCGRHGIPTIGYAPGEERYAHTNRERLSLDDARAAFDAYPDVILRVMEAA